MDLVLTPEQTKNIAKKTWRLQNFYKIVDKNRRLMLFTPNRAQKHFFNHKGKRNILLKSRQLGFTTLASIDMLDDILFNRNFHSLFIADDKEHALNIFDQKVMLAWNNFPLRQFYIADSERANQLKVGFSDKEETQEFSSIQVRLTGRSGTFNRVHISEYGKICLDDPRKANEIITGTFPSVPLDGRIDIESTAEADWGYFHDMFWEAWLRDPSQIIRPTEFKAFFYNWQWDDNEIAKISQPDAQLPFEFREYQARHNRRVAQNPVKFIPIDDIQLTYYFYKWLELGRDWNKLHSQYPTTPEESFISSGEKLFDQEKVDALLSQIREGEKIGSWIYYAKYQSNHRYALAADPAEGAGRDSSAAVIMDFTPLAPEVVAIYANNLIAPDLFAYELCVGAKTYGLPLIAVERNNTGHATLTKLKEIYPVEMIYKEIKEGYEEDRETECLGWLTSMATKPKMFFDLKTAINDGLIKIPSKEIVHELRTYDRRDLGNSIKTQEQTQHWDLLTALAICFQMRTHLELARGTIKIITRHTQKDLHAVI